MAEAEWSAQRKPGATSAIGRFSAMRSVKCAPIAARITFGDHAFMHLHVLDPDRRAAGIGTAAVRASASIYFELLRLRRLFFAGSAPSCSAPACSG
mgnify:CR=1 FL=1